jgi:AmiR/NasT family two-component response regulator
LWCYLITGFRCYKTEIILIILRDVKTKMEHSKVAGKILVSCQNTRVLKLIRKSLKNVRCTIVEPPCLDRTELIKMVSSEHPDITIIDFQKPTPELVQLHRDIFSKNNRPIMMVTTYHTPKNTIRVFDLNVAGYLTEPLKPSDLKEWLKVDLFIHINKPIHNIGLELTS